MITLRSDSKSWVETGADWQKTGELPWVHLHSHGQGDRNLQKKGLCGNIPPGVHLCVFLLPPSPGCVPSPCVSALSVE